MAQASDDLEAPTLSGTSAGSGALTAVTRCPAIAERLSAAGFAPSTGSSAPPHPALPQLPCLAATGDAAFIEGCEIMQTARRARPSIGETNNSHITAFDHLLDDRFGRGARVRRFLEAKHI